MKVPCFIILVRIEPWCRVEDMDHATITDLSEKSSWLAQQIASCLKADNQLIVINPLRAASPGSAPGKCWFCVKNDEQASGIVSSVVDGVILETTRGKVWAATAPKGVPASKIPGPVRIYNYDSRRKEWRDFNSNRPQPLSHGDLLETREVEEIQKLLEVLSEWGWGESGDFIDVG